MKIVSVCPSNTDLLEHLGALHYCVGRDTWSDWPQTKVKEIPLVGSVLNINIEKVTELKPDLILASLNVPGMDKVVPKLEATGFPMRVYDPECWDDVINDILDLGAYLNLKERSHEVVETAKEQVEQLQELTADLPEIGMMIEWWADPIYTAFNKSYVNQVLSWVKVRNVFEHKEGRSGVVTKEEIYKANPEIYALSWCGTPWKDYDLSSVYKRLPEAEFVKRENVFSLWEGIIGHPSLRLLDGACQILQFRRQMGL